MDRNGNLYGPTHYGGGQGYGTVFKLSPNDAETVLHRFDRSDGGWPEYGLVLDEMGNLYGTTSGGGANGFGTVFELNPNGTETVTISVPNRIAALDMTSSLTEAPYSWAQRSEIVALLTSL
jgi:uncharacterized repeat protein (TIGR03803 family)